MNDIILDKEKREIARIEVASEDGILFSGEIEEVTKVPQDIRELFGEYSERVNTQVFAGLDRYDKIIEDYGFSLSQSGQRIHDLQIMGNRVSFKVDET